MANISSDANVPSVTSKRHHFKLAATYLLPFCPVLKKFRSGTKRDVIEISDTTALVFGTNPSNGTSGVNLSHRETNFDNGTTSLSGASRERPKDVAKAKEAMGEGRDIASAVYKTMKAISKKKGEEEESRSSKALNVGQRYEEGH
eukprot:7178525-Ditylum_brightwellii.AAC.2